MISPLDFGYCKKNEPAALAQTGPQTAWFLFAYPLNDNNGFMILLPLYQLSTQKYGGKTLVFTRRMTSVMIGLSQSETRMSSLLLAMRIGLEPAN
jgi:hypothetical protein